MKIRFVGNKAIQASEKHFNGELDEHQMKLLAKTIIDHKTHLGKSDRSNGSYAPAYIVWGEVDGITYQLTIDSADIKLGYYTIVSFFDVRNPEHKAKRFNMKRINK